MLTALDIAFHWLRFYRLMEALWGDELTCVVLHKPTRTLFIPTQMLLEMQQTVEHIEKLNRKTIRLVKG